MPSARVRRRTVARVRTKGRVVKVLSTQQWNKILKRAGKKLVFVMFSTEFGRNSHQFRQVMSDLSGQDNFKQVDFALVDIEKNADIAQTHSVSESPVFACFQNGELLEKTQKIEHGYAAAQMWQLLQKHANRIKAEGGNSENKGGILLKIGGAILAAGAVAAGAAAYIFMNQEDESGPSTSGNVGTRRSSGNASTSRRPAIDRQAALSSTQWWSDDEDDLNLGDDADLEDDDAALGGQNVAADEYDDADDVRGFDSFEDDDDF